MANILTHPTNGAIYFDDGTAGSSSVPALTGDAVSLNYDGSAGLNITSYNTTSTDRFSIDGDSGRLFSVNDSLTGTIFSVNDAAGLPIIEVESTSSTDTITMGTYASNALVVAGDRVGIGTASPGSSYKLDVTGDVNINGDIVLGGKLDFSGNITAATSDTDVFVVIDAGELKTRTGAQVLSDIGALSSETVTSLALTSGSLVYTNESGTANSISLAAYLDEDSRSIASGSLNSTNGIVTFTRDDSTTFTLDLGDLLDDTNLVTSVAGKSGVVSLVKGDVGLGNVTNESKATMFTSPSFTGGGNTATLKKGSGNAALAFAGTSDQASALIEGIAGGGLKIYTSNGGTLSSPSWSTKMTIAAGGNTTFTGTVSAPNLTLTSLSAQTSELTALMINGSNVVGTRELGSAAFSATSAFAPATGSTSIVSLGTVVTGDWNAGVISSTYLDADTAHLSGTQTFSGAKTFSSGLNISVSTSNTQLKLKRTGTATGEFNIYTNNDSLFFNNVGQSSYPMAIDEDGNVGIGTTSPQQKLHVEGNIYLGPNNTNNFIHSGAALGLQSDSHIFIVSDVNDTSGVGGTDIIFGYGSSTNTDSNQDFTESELGTYPRVEVMRIDSSTDRVGIGTTSPSEKLDVSGNAKILGRLYVNLSGENSRFNSLDANGPYVSFRNNGTAKGYIGSAYHLWGSPNNLSDNFAIRAENRLDFGIAANVKMTLNSSGNVGIGTVSPSVKLEIQTATNTSGAEEGLRLYNAGGGIGAGVRIGLGVGATYDEKGHIRTDIVSGGAGRLLLGSNGTDRLVINENGKVLVNGAEDNSGKADFAVSGGTAIAFRNSQVQMGGTDMNWNSKIFDDGEARWAAWDRNIEIFSTGSNTGSATARDIIFSPQTSGSAASTERMRIKGNGNVGIGTTSPTAKLQVYSTATSNIFISGHGTSAQNNWAGEHAFFVNAGNGIIVGKANANNDTNRLYTFYNDAQGNAEQYIYNTSNVATIKLDSAGDTYFNGGNVGIGDTTPSYKLDVAGDIRATGDLRADDDVFIAGDVLRFTNDAASAYIQSADALILEADYDADDTGGKPITFKTAGTTKMTIAGGGDVTINNGLIVSGDLTVNGTTSTINSTTVQVDDKNIELGTVATPTDTTADGGGITLKGTTDKTINWLNSTGAWTFSEKVSVTADESVFGGSGGIPLYVRSTGTVSYVQIQNSSTGSSGTNDGLTVGCNGTAGYLWLREAANLNIGTNDTTAITISSSQNTTFAGDLTVSGEVEFSALNSASASPFVVSDGGTLGTRTAAEVLDDIGGRATKKISGDGSATTFTVTHSFGTPHVMTQLLHYGNNGTGATYEVVQATVKRNSDNAIDVVFGTAPTSSEDYLVLITKMPAIS